MKNIAVIIRERRSEALRMAIGLSILNNVNIFLMDGKLNMTEDILMNLEMAKELRLKIYTNDLECFEQLKNINQDIEYQSTEDIAKKILEYDNILAY